MKPNDLPFFKQIQKLPFIFAFFLMLQLTGCGERSEQVGENEEVQQTQEQQMQETISLNSTLAGNSSGDPDGSGTASVTIDTENGEVCYEIEVSDIDDPTMAHIHRGTAEETGGVAVNFNTPENGMSGCVTETDPEVIEEIIENPANFYVNVHNEEYPGGAVRGQLEIP